MAIEIVIVIELGIVPIFVIETIIEIEIEIVIKI